MPDYYCNLPHEDLISASNHISDVWPALNDANIFITGGTGFIGQWISALLLAGAEVHDIDLNITLLTRNPEYFALKNPSLANDPRVSLKQGDVRFFEFPKGAFTHVIHAATDTSAEADANALNLMDTIVDGSRRTLEFAQASGAGKFLFLSSGAVYGPMPNYINAFSETDNVACNTLDMSSNYGQAKRFAEQLCSIYANTYNIDCMTARLFAHVGPGMEIDAHFAIGNFIRDAMTEKGIVIKGDGTPIRSYLYAADTAAWLLKVLVKGNNTGIYNVGSYENFSLKEIAQSVANAVMKEPIVDVLGETEGGPSHRNKYVPDISKAKRELDLDVWTDLAQCAVKTANWFKNSQSKKSIKMPPSFGLQEGSDGKTLTFVVDIDGVIAALTPCNDYTLATPLTEMITAVNALYDDGHEIILLTARGYKTGIDWSDVTAQQMKSWGVKYHELKFGKPAADYYVDDRLLSISQFKNLARS